MPVLRSSSATEGGEFGVRSSEFDARFGGQPMFVFPAQIIHALALALGKAAGMLREISGELCLPISHIDVGGVIKAAQEGQTPFILDLNLQPGFSLVAAVYDLVGDVVAHFWLWYLASGVWIGWSVEPESMERAQSDTGIGPAAGKNGDDD